MIKSEKGKENGTQDGTLQDATGKVDGFVVSFQIPHKRTKIKKEKVPIILLFSETFESSHPWWYVLCRRVDAFP